MQIAFCQHEDIAISKEMEKQLKKRGINIVTKAEISPSSIVKGDNSVTINANVNGEEKKFEAEKMLFQ